MPTTIAIDAMGSDKAPKPEVEGAILAARHHDVDVLLVGPEDQVRAELRSHPTARFLSNLKVVHASEVIGMHDKAAQAVRSKKQSSMHVGLRLVREGKAAGFFTAGNTGAAMAATKMILGALPGVDRPALAAVFPTAAGTASMMLDVGANVDCKPHNLEQWAIMGDAYFRSIFAIQRPRVGVLSVGEEETKGNDLTRSVFQLLKKLPINFIGNVALKVSEGLVTTVRALLKESLSTTVSRQVGYLLSRRAFEDFKKRLDYSEYGGAPLLGVKGVCIVGHGSSNPNAVKNAIRVAAEFANSNVNDKIAHGLAQVNGAAK